MKIERDERKFDFHEIGLAIKKAREREGMTQERLGYIVDRDPRTILSVLKGFILENTRFFILIVSKRTSYSVFFSAACRFLKNPAHFLQKDCYLPPD